MKIKIIYNKIVIFLIILSIYSSLLCSEVLAWKQESSLSFENPNFTTHQWIAQETIKLSPSTSKIQWITNNELAFWLGVEAPFNAIAAYDYDSNYLMNYGDISDLVLYLDSSGTIVTDSSLADRAQGEMEKLILELSKIDVNHELAAFYAGAMTHYISQAGLYAVIWDESLWGSLDLSVWNNFEQQIEDTLLGNYYDDDSSFFSSSKFTIEPYTYSNVNASQAVISLAKFIHPIAQYLGNNFGGSWASVDDWNSFYKDTVNVCLNASAGFIYSTLNYAMCEVDWNYLVIDTPDFTYDSENGHLTIPEFSVYFTNETGKYVLTDNEATTSEYRLVIEPDSSNKRILSEGVTLLYNGETNKWYLDSHLLFGSEHFTTHTILYLFKMDCSTYTWSNYSESVFEVGYFEFTMSDFEVTYNYSDWSLSIANIQCSIPAIPEIGCIDETDITSAQWILYTTAEDTIISDPLAIPAYNTEGAIQRGDLYFNATDDTWYSMGNDIGLVYTQANQVYFVKVLMSIEGIPVGYYRDSSYGPLFVPYMEGLDDYYFKTRDHQITITQPMIFFDSVTNVLDIYSIYAFSDYHNTLLDFYEIVQKPVYGIDVREAIWQIFYETGESTSLMGDLDYEFLTEFWFKEDINVSSLYNGNYYVKVKISNMNVNATIKQWSSPSLIFTIVNGAPLPQPPPSTTIPSNSTTLTNNFPGNFFGLLTIFSSGIFMLVFIDRKTKFLRKK